MLIDYWKKYFKEYAEEIKHDYRINKNFMILRDLEDELKTDIFHTTEDIAKYDKELYVHLYRIKEDGTETECDV